MGQVGFVHVQEPGFAGGGTELRTIRLCEAVKEKLGRVSLTLVPGVQQRPWALERLRAAGRGVPLRLSRLSSAAVAGEVRKAMAGLDLTIASTSFTAAVIDPERLDRVILDAHNLEWRVAGQLARSSQGWLRRQAYRATTGWTRHFEFRLAQSVAGVWAVSTVEAEWFARLGVRVWVVPNGVQLPLDPPLPTGDVRQMLFVGSLNSLFNRQGIEWLFSEVWPILRKDVPDVRLTIVGAGPPMALPQGVEQLGFVEDLGPLYAAAQLCVAPLLGGAGTRLKIVEAMAHARPVVTTRIGSEGLAATEDDGVFNRDRPEGFAAACRDLLTDPSAAADNGRRARSKATEFSWERVASVALDSLRELSPS